MEVRLKTVIRSLILCRRIKPAALVDALQCQQCELFGGEVIVMRYEESVIGDDGKPMKDDNGNVIRKEIAPPTVDYLCKLPTKIRVQRQVSEV